MKYVALLRGIAPTNPNMHNEKLREVFEELGFANVRTVISSGNVLFESASRAVKTLEDTIEKALLRRLGFHSTTIIRSEMQLQKMVAEKPFGRTSDAPTSRLNVTFLKKSPRVKIRFPYRSPDQSYTLVGLHDKAIFSAIDLSGASTPDVMSWLEKTFGKEITTRTWKTVHRILNKFKEM